MAKFRAQLIFNYIHNSAYKIVVKRKISILNQDKMLFVEWLNHRSNVQMDAMASVPSGVVVLLVNSVNVFVVLQYFDYNFKCVGYLATQWICLHTRLFVWTISLY